MSDTRSRLRASVGNPSILELLIAFVVTMAVALTVLWLAVGEDGMIETAPGVALLIGIAVLYVLVVKVITARRR